MKTFLILVLLATATPAVAQTSPTTAISPLGPGSALLSLSAEGRSRRSPDLANFSAGVVTQGRNAAEAMAANSRQMDSVIAALRPAGIAERDIQTSAISLQPRYNNPEREAQMRGRMPDPPRIIGYEARNSVQCSCAGWARWAG